MRFASLGVARLPVLAATCLANLSTHATAQDFAASDATSQSGTAPLCAVYAVEGVEEARNQVQANCQGRGYILGPADHFVTSVNPRLNATIVELRLDGGVKLLLFRPDLEGQAMLENITADMAVSAGRAPWAELDDLAFDHSQFGVDGTIQARGVVVGDLSEARIDPPIPGRLSVGDILARESERRATTDLAAE